MLGEISVESTVGKGSTFRVVLPVAPPEAADAPQGAGDAPPRAPSRPRARILVVDDEPLIGAVLERTLGEEHEVVTCGGAREALERLARGETFDLVFSDLLMPELSGIDLHAELARTHPALAERVVFLTGGACTEAARAFLARPGREWVEKPFDLDSIRRIIARRLPAA
jgi:DNA-binding NtrC family response regulator